MRTTVVVHPHLGRTAALVDETRRWIGETPALVWAGDPTMRPVAPAGARWADLDLSPIAGVPWGLAQLAVAADAYGLARAAAEAGRHDDVTLVLDGRSVVVAGPVDAPRDRPAVIRRDTANDGLAPSLADLARVGTSCGAAVSIPGDLAAVFAARLLAAGPEAALGHALDAALAGSGSATLPGTAIGWSGPEPAMSLIDLSSLDRDDPWRLGFRGAPPRVLLSEHPDLAAAAADFVPDPGEPMRLPGGAVCDLIVRRLVADAVGRWRRGEADLPPDPWGEPAAFIEWLETPANPWEPDIGRYWYALWQDRPDLQHVFPDPSGADLDPFRDWADDRYRHELHSPVVRSGSLRATDRWTAAGCDSGGIDLIGYFGTEVSLANVSRRMQSALAAAGIPHTTTDFRRSGSPRLADAPATDDELRYDTVVAIVNPDQVPALLAEHGDVLSGRRLIGYWHWDVEHVPAGVIDQMRHFDQIWVLNEWTERTLAAVSTGPTVRSLPIRVPEPERSDASRSDLGLPDDRFVFLVTLDHLSVTERKNPIGAIEAFRRAFPEPTADGPVMMVKTMNADQRWAEHERVRLAASGRPDIVVVDRRLPLGDQMALIGHADALVSLHRSEGLGLHLVEAMWLRTPTVATRYSGNLSFMDDSNSLLVDATMIPVERGEGFFPAEATWADPDLDQAAHCLRRLVEEPSLGRDLAEAGRRRMEEQATFEATGRTIAAWCEIEAR